MVRKEKTDYRSLPTSQLMALCDTMGLPQEVQDSKETMIKALEKASKKESEEPYREGWSNCNGDLGGNPRSAPYNHGEDEKRI